MTLTRLRWWHLAQVLAIEADLFGPQRWTAGMFWSELAAGHHYLAALGDDGDLVGYAGLAAAPPTEAWVQNIAVARSAQRRGVGRALLEALLADADGQDVREVLLEVAADNAPAQRLYDAYGFVAVGVRRGYYQPGNTDAIVMRRRR